MIISIKIIIKSEFWVRAYMTHQYILIKIDQMEISIDPYFLINHCLNKMDRMNFQKFYNFHVLSKILGENE